MNTFQSTLLAPLMQYMSALFSPSHLVPDPGPGLKTQFDLTWTYTLLPLARALNVHQALGLNSRMKKQLYKDLQQKSPDQWLDLLRSLSTCLLVWHQRFLRTKDDTYRSRHQIGFFLDDTTLLKEGNAFDDLTLRIYDHVNHVYGPGYQMVQLIAVIGEGELVLPVAFAFRLPADPAQPDLLPETKPAIACRLLEQVLTALKEEAGGLEYVTLGADSWYGVKDLADLARQYTIPYVSKAKGNLVFTKGQESGKIAHWLPQADWKTSSQLPEGVRYCQQVMTHATLGTLRVTFYQDGKRTFALYSTDPTQKSPRMLAIYKKRWKIEEFFRCGKQLLGWEFHVRSREGIAGHLALRQMTFLLLEMLQHNVPEFRSKTLGQIVREYHEIPTVIWAEMWSGGVNSEKFQDNPFNYNELEAA